MFSQNCAPGGALEHNQLSGRLAVYLFFLIAMVLLSLVWASCLPISLAYGSCLMVDIRQCSCYGAAFLVTLKSNLPLESAVQFDRD